MAHYTDLPECARGCGLPPAPGSHPGGDIYTTYIPPTKPHPLFTTAHLAAGEGRWLYLDKGRQCGAAARP